MTAVTFTSIDAYRSLEGNGTLTRQQAVIVGAMAHGRDYSLQELVAATGLPVNVVSGRVNELKTSGRLVLAEKRPCSRTGRLIAPVRLPAAGGEQGALFS
ncbi:MAG: hypothetical protein SHS37scaffold220_30 [Phage 67_12]|nr:MAG: hypothetical protein SHS37scaffold220_30 [Phage 67_12]